MKNIFFVAMLILLFTNISKAQKDFLYKISSSVEWVEPYTTGYVNNAGDTIIPVGKYLQCYTEVFDKIAIVAVENSGTYAIDRYENILFEVLISDNGPDPIKDGLFRIIKNSKIGYANMEGKIVIKPQFEHATPFNSGYAAICTGGQVEKKGDHNVIIGAKWGVINTLGDIIIKPQYEAVSLIETKLGKIKAKKNGAWIVLDIK